MRSPILPPSLPPSLRKGKSRYVSGDKGGVRGLAFLDAGREGAGGREGGREGRREGGNEGERVKDDIIVRVAALRSYSSDLPFLLVLPHLLLHNHPDSITQALLFLAFSPTIIMIA